MNRYSKSFVRSRNFSKERKKGKKEKKAENIRHRRLNFLTSVSNIVRPIVEKFYDPVGEKDKVEKSLSHANVSRVNES